MFKSTTIICFPKRLYYFVVWGGGFFANEDIIFEAKLQIRMIEVTWKMRIHKNSYKIKMSCEDFGL